MQVYLKVHDSYIILKREESAKMDILAVKGNFFFVLFFNNYKKFTSLNGNLREGVKKVQFLGDMTPIRWGV